MTTLTEGRHPGEFLISEANGHQSREAGKVAASQTLKSGHVVVKVPTEANKAATATTDSDNDSAAALTLANPAFAAGAAYGRYTVECIVAETNAGADNNAQFGVYAPDGSFVGQATQNVAFTGIVKFTIPNASGAIGVGDRWYIDIADVYGKLSQTERLGLGDGVLTAASPAVDAATVKQGRYKLVMTTTGATAAFDVYDPNGFKLALAGAVGSAYNGEIKFTLADGGTDFTAGEEVYVDVNLNVDDFEWKEFDPAAHAAPSGVIYAGVTSANPSTTKAAFVVRQAEVFGGALEWKSGMTEEQKRAAERQLRDLLQIRVRGANDPLYPQNS